jgi:hypothetical protein
LSPSEEREGDEEDTEDAEGHGGHSRWETIPECQKTLARGEKRLLNSTELTVITHKSVKAREAS